MPRASNKGGKRSPSGRKPRNPRPYATGGTVPNHAHPGTELIPAGLDTAIAWYVRGVPKVEIARRLNRTPPTIGRWITQNQTRVKEALADLVDPSESLRPLLPQATGAFSRSLSPKSPPQVQLLAAKDIYDRLYGKPVVRQVIDARERIVISFVDHEDGNEQS